ncbi:MAG: class I SAM-dependent methyltransferase [Chloroflexi bacterium]|nr:MAG: hypothetical protein CUN54_08000 [Phototrophicales bacterium]RMF79976.1 MAG: class I SAM-dependent methyltransferase [Chloroflexota bacterium]
MSPLNNPDAVRRQYINDVHLRRQREIMTQYAVNKINFPEWVLRCFYWRGGETVLDLGAGGGWYYPAFEQVVPNTTYYALDFSVGVLATHPASESLVLGDALQIPFADNSFDVIMANHMMYYLPDLDAGIQEIRRVLKPNGSLLAATNSSHNMPEFQALFRRAILLLTSPGTARVKAPPSPSDSFSLESGLRRLSRHFLGIVRYDMPNQLVFTEAEPALEYINSTRGLREAQLPPGVNWDEAMLIISQQMNALIEHLGELVVSTLAGVLIASDAGGIFEEFFKYRRAL